MERMRIQRFSAPDETVTFVDKGRIEVLHVGDGTVARAIFEPGWRWARHEQPVVGTRSCEVAHTGYVLSGRLRIRMDDGHEMEIAPGDWITVPPGHDAWTVGDEACVILDVSALGAGERAGREARTEAPRGHGHGHARH